MRQNVPPGHDTLFKLSLTHYNVDIDFPYAQQPTPTSCFASQRRRAVDYIVGIQLCRACIHHVNGLACRLSIRRQTCSRRSTIVLTLVKTGAVM